MGVTGRCAEGQGAAWPAAQGESDWADAGAQRSHHSQASLQASPAHPAAGSGTVTVPCSPCLDPWTTPMPERDHSPKGAPGKEPLTQGCPLNWDKRCLLFRPWYVDEEPPCGPSPPGRRQQDQDRGYPVHTALQIRGEMPQGTPAIPPHSGHGGHPWHPAHWDGNSPQQPTAGLASSPGTGVWDRTRKTMYREASRGCSGGSCTKIALVSTQIRAGPGSGAVSAISLNAAKYRGEEGREGSIPDPVWGEKGVLGVHEGDRDAST